MADKTSVVYRNVRPAGTGVCAALVVFFAGCSEEPTVPLDGGAEPVAPQAAFSVRIDCAVDIGKGGDLECEPAGGMNGESSGGPSHNLVVGSQHRYVRMANDAPVMDATTWSANVTVQNLTLQPFGTLDGTTAEAAGVRVFFVDEPNNGVEVLNHDGEATFTEAVPQKYYEYSGALLGGDEVLMPGETSGAKTWQFALNGATKFRFSVLVWTEVPDPDAYSVRLTRISAGYGHTCGHDLDGKLYCWGDNRYGQLGDGTNTDRLTPVAVQVPAGVMLSGVSAGADHTCADGSDGQVYCWGSNAYGQLGDGTKTGRDTPVAVQAPEGVVLSGVSAGYLHTCANGSDGSVYCWGHNSDGQLGDGTTTASPIPLAVPAPAAEVTHSEVSAGRFHTCAHGSDGNVYCWGYNGSGQLGDGTTTNRWTPVAVKALEGVTLSGVSVGAFHTCADGSDGQVYCWGANGYGQLGDGTNTSRDMPVPVQAPEGVVLSGVSVGHSHACAIDPNGELFCWGYNYYGQLGDGTRINRLTPVAVQVPTAHTTLTVSAGYYHACGLSVAGPAYCWGSNVFGQLGDGRTATSILPVIVAGTR